MDRTLVHSWSTNARAPSTFQELLGRLDATEGDAVPAPTTLSLTPDLLAYLDYNATAPLRTEARQAMIRAWEFPGNAASVHAYGQRSRELLQRSRQQLAALVDCAETEIVFTSGA